jgi:Flp pilus assembly protein TadD
LREAEPLLARAIRLEPGDPAAHINYGVALARQSRLEEAIDQFRIALKLAPESSAARYNLAAALMVQGQKREAIELLRPIASADSPDPFARRAQAMLHSMPSATTRSNQN